ncbi:DegT/DnrJ/EryC1/StrS family aminotransferase [Delftia acidovorans]|uniref:DegT/DnrJ/EryC1/StrS family aminotransferase n=1 Tax=Delftia acidovorans TaxID=80866 RepID=A0A7T2S1L6_DELAC|nr:DegT/DnrJ/EryC1/StrS family aminotransferase [Delftia acidovorans]QPS07164.1 DegT/DnrJ/EryC1/StrS family aminotransferase [Delftia acidovorans]
MSGDITGSDWVPLLVPDMPSPQVLMPWLERMHAARHYSNFGPLVRELEAEFAQLFAIPVDELTTVTNATLGLELVLSALDMPRGSRVLLPAFTFVATATAVVRAGHIPVLADVDSNTWMLTPEIARAACTETHIDAVLPVATFGMPHDMQAWQLFEQETGLPVVVDAAAAYGSQWLQGAQGTLVFSMHATKSLPAGEGGLVVSTRPGLAARVRQLSNFGINLDPASGMPVGALASVGSNAKLSEYHAAICLASLQIWKDHAYQRRLLQSELVNALDEACDQRLTWQMPGVAGGLQAPSLLCVRLPSERFRVALERCCNQDRIMVRRWYQPLLQDMPALMSSVITLNTDCARSLARTLLGLPFFLGMNLNQKELIRHAARRAWIECSGEC